MVADLGLVTGAIREAGYSAKPHREAYALSMCSDTA